MTTKLQCFHCGDVFIKRSEHGPIPKYCSAACRQAAYRRRRVHDTTVHILSEHYHDESYVIGVYTTHERAQAEIDRYERAVKAAARHGKVGSSTVLDIEERKLNGERVTVDKHHFLYRYIEAEAP